MTTQLTTHRRRKPTAILLALAIALGGVIAAPTAAFASNATIAEQVLSSMNYARALDSEYKFSNNFVMNDIAKDEAIDYSSCGAGCVASAYEIIDQIPAGATNVEVIFSAATGTDRGSVIGNALVSAHSSSITGFANYAAVGVHSTSTKSFAVVILARYASTPMDRFEAKNTVIEGTAAVGYVLKANIGQYFPAPSAVFFEWKANDKVIVNGNGNATYNVRPDDIGSIISVTVTAVRSGYYTSIRESNETVAVIKGSMFREAVSVTGARNVGETLIAAHNLWAPVPDTFSYQWYRNNVKITGATNFYYPLTSADKGTRIDVIVTGKKFGYFTATSRTNASKLVGGRLFTSATTPAIIGNPMYGSTLSLDFVPWTPTPTTQTFQWKANGVAISGATKSKFKLTAATIGKKITVTVTGSRSGYATTRKTSVATASVEARPFVTVPTPMVTGSLKTGSVLTASIGTWEPTPTTQKFQWYRNGVAISGATAKTYKITSADAGTTLKVKVRSLRSGYVITNSWSSNILIGLTKD